MSLWRCEAYLESIGDFVVVVDDDKYYQVHIHTDNPGRHVPACMSRKDNTNIKNR